MGLFHKIVDNTDNESNSETASRAFAGMTVQGYLELDKTFGNKYKRTKLCTVFVV